MIVIEILFKHIFPKFDKNMLCGAIGTGNLNTYLNLNGEKRKILQPVAVASAERERERTRERNGTGGGAERALTRVFFPNSSWSDRTTPDT